MKEILKIIHKTIYQFFDVCEDDEEVPMSDKDKLLLEVNKAICNNLKALEQQPCEDCISRQATVERLCKVAEFMNEKRNGLGSPYVMVALFIQDNKDEFPPVTPQPKIGHWERVQYEYTPKVGNWHCSECRCIAIYGTEKNEKDVISLYHYCPNCGAKMEVDG